MTDIECKNCDNFNVHLQAVVGGNVYVLIQCRNCGNTIDEISIYDFVRNKQSALRQRNPNLKEIKNE